MLKKHHAASQLFAQATQQGGQLLLGLAHRRIHGSHWSGLGGLIWLQEPGIGLFAAGAGTKGGPRTALGGAAVAALAGMAALR